MADDRFDQNLTTSFGMMQSSSSSSSKNRNSIKLKEIVTNYDMGELDDQALFLYFDGHDEDHSRDEQHKETLNMFPSQPMYVDFSDKDDLSLLPSTSNSFKGKGKAITTSVIKKEEKKNAASSSDLDGPKTPNAKTLRRLAQNREAAKKSRLRKKIYIQQLEISRMKLLHLQQELQRTRTQGMLLNRGEQNLSCSGAGGLSSDAVAFEMEYGRWKEEHHRLICDLQASIEEQLPENEIQIYIDKCVAHYDMLMSLKNAITKCDVFYLVSGIWMSLAERCLMWIGGFRPTLLLKIILRNIEPQSEQQLLGICSLQQSVQETEQILSQEIEAHHHSITDTIISDITFDLSCSSINMTNYMSQMSLTLNKLNDYQGFVAQADNLRHHTIHRLHQILNTRQAAQCFLAMADYFHRLRTLSSVWAQTHRKRI